MTSRNHPNMRSTVLACCLAAAFAAQAADTGTTTSTTTTTTATPTTTTTTATPTTATTTSTIGTSTNTEAKLSAEFAEFLGGTEQASAVVSGLRQGTTFSLDAASGTTSTPGTTGTTSTTGTSTTTTTTTTSSAIDPPTGTMGYGNVRITLRLAQAELSKLGITQPTTEELSAVLLGGDINGTPVDGILTLRADGMGWGQIAKEYGMTVGQIMGKGAVPAKQATSTATATQTSPSGKAGYISSATTKAPASQAHSNGYIPSGNGKAHGAGIVTAAGGSVSVSENGGGKGQAHKATAQGAGSVSAGGQHVSMSGASNAGGGSNAMAPGQAKKN